MSVQANLREELTVELDELSKVEFGSEKYKVGATCIAQLTDRWIEMSKMENEEAKLNLEREKLEIEYQRLEDERKDRKTKNRISVFGIAAPSIIAVVGGVAMFIYEERGSITSQAGRKIIDKYIFRVK
nr:MAG TPA: hypothetical protein [Bacteriophage sp.]